MGSRFLNRSTFVGHHQHEQEVSENSAQNSADSPRFSMLSEGKAVSTSSQRKSTGKRSIPKRVVSVPIKDVEGSRFKGEMGTPPSDSWAWRKYGQKPIKGSPYPRGYYRCSSSKGCPARKQVERSRLDPNMLLVTYSCEHNHPGPAARNQNNHTQISPNSIKPAKIARRDTSKATTSMNSEEEDDEDDEEEEKPTKFASQAELMNQSHEEKLVANSADCPSLIMPSTNDFIWFPDFECTTSSTMLESPILGEDRVTDEELMRMAFTMRDDDEPFFADLGLLPECTKAFRRQGTMERDEERRFISLAPWCGTSG